MRLYSSVQWKKCRLNIIELDGGRCSLCKRPASKDVILQVHHKEYILGKLPWEYSPDTLTTLCKSCHAQEHGLVRPRAGWSCVGEDDLGEPSGECELCGRNIRYVFFVDHPKWASMEVGTVCCDHLTETEVATKHIQHIERRKRFLNSSRWSRAPDGVLSILEDNIKISVCDLENEFAIVVNGHLGRRRFLFVEEAKKFVFEMINDGSLVSYIEKSKLKRSSETR